MITRDKLEAVKAELLSMGRAICALEDAVAADNYDFWQPKQSGAVRRASMDLTRALADLRRSN